jgi:hypothetical protein
MKKYRESLAYCGLICDLCVYREKCAGCKQIDNFCEKNCSTANCYQKKCCLNKKLNGCWECNDIYKCEKGIYSLGDFSKVKAFALCIKEDGQQKFIEQVLRNMDNGWSVEKGKDYDHKTVKEVLLMLREGKNYKNKN